MKFDNKKLDYLKKNQFKKLILKAINEPYK